MAMRSRAEATVRKYLEHVATSTSSKSAVEEANITIEVQAGYPWCKGSAIILCIYYGVLVFYVLYGQLELLF